MQTLFLIAAFIAFMMMINLYEKRRSLRKLRLQIKNQFGKKPLVSKYDKELLDYYWDEYEKTIADDEKIDEVTWNDLEMNHVFKRINNCNSFVGEQVLYGILHSLPKENYSREVLEKKISFFTLKAKEREDIQVILSRLGKSKENYYLPAFLAKADAFRMRGIWKYRILQVLLIESILPAILLQNVNFLFLPLCLFLVNMVIYAINKIKYEVDLGMLSSIVNVVTVGNKIADTKKFCYEKEFDDLKKLTEPFKKLSNMISMLQRKKDASVSGDAFGLLYDYLLGATLWDFIKYDQILRMLENKQKEYMTLYQKVGELDMAITIASFRESLPIYCTPTFTDEHVLKMEEIYHPLIKEPICNTVTLDKSCIITGSNASGKSTFIKAVALNVLLAQNIHTCMAKQMVLPYARIISSMAVRDDLMSGESYYIKEIKYLNRIIQSLSEDRLVFCAIDEILRGTNTEERIAASSSILKFIDNKNCIAMVASHDIELTQLLENTYDNYHFTELIDEKDISFDYKIQEGPTTSRNAIKLLEYVGFPEEIIVEAKRPFIK